MKVRSLRPRHSLGAAILAVLAASAAFAQTEQHYVALTYMHTLPGKAAEFRKFAETDMIKIGQTGVDEGVLDAYYILRLTVPYVTGSDYDYVQAVWYKNRPSLASPDVKVWDARVKKAGYANYQQYLDKRDSLAKLVRSTWRLAMARIGEIHTGNYMRTATYEVDRDYRPIMAQFLREYTMPLAQGRMNEGKGAMGWGVTRPAPAMGSDDEAGFSYSVSVVLKDSDTLMGGPGAVTEEGFKKAVPGKSYSAYIVDLTRLNEHRKVTMTRIHEVIGVAGAPPTIKMP